jgi:hypothetical protein
MDKEVALARARSQTGFADDVRTPEDVRGVLTKIAGSDIDIWQAYAQNQHLCATARDIAQKELEKFRTRT